MSLQRQTKNDIMSKEEWLKSENRYVGESYENYLLRRKYWIKERKFLIK